MHCFQIEGLQREIEATYDLYRRESLLSLFGFTSLHVKYFPTHLKANLCESVLKIARAGNAAPFKLLDPCAYFSPDMPVTMGDYNLCNIARAAAFSGDESETDKLLLDLLPDLTMRSNLVRAYWACRRSIQISPNIRLSVGWTAIRAAMLCSPIEQLYANKLSSDIDRLPLSSKSISEFIQSRLALAVAHLAQSEAQIDLSYWLASGKETGDYPKSVFNEHDEFDVETANRLNGTLLTRAETEWLKRYGTQFLCFV